MQTPTKHPKPATIFEALETGMKLGTAVEDGTLPDTREDGTVYADVVPTDGV